MNWLEKSARKLAFVGIILLFLSGFADAQTFRGTILGTVMDSTGAAIPGARVVIKNQGTAQTRHHDRRSGNLHRSRTSRWTICSHSQQGRV